MSEDNYTDTKRVHWLREGDSTIPDEAVAYVDEVISMMTTSVFTEDMDLSDTPTNFQESLRENREAIYTAFRKADNVLCEALRDTIDVTIAKSKTLEDTPKNNEPKVHWLREGDSPIPNEAVAYVEGAISVIATSVTPENFQESLRENREAIYKAFRKADDALCDAIEEVLTPLAKEYAEYLYGDQDEVEEEEGE